MGQGRYVGDQYRRLIDALGAGIVSGRLSSGQVLTLDAVGTEHLVSRSVAREVIRVLESMGMVRTRRRIGITVTPTDQWNMFDPRIIRWRLEAGDRAAQLASLAELRHAVEPAAAALAARRADPQHCRTLAVAVSDMAIHVRSDASDSYLQADQLFHHTLMEASGNEMFRALSNGVTQMVCACNDRSLGQQQLQVLELHDDVARAVRLRDEFAAEQAMRAILTEAQASSGAQPDLRHGASTTGGAVPLRLPRR